jgi:hypothetical protein
VDSANCVTAARQNWKGAASKGKGAEQSRGPCGETDTGSASSTDFPISETMETAFIITICGSPTCSKDHQTSSINDELLRCSACNRDKMFTMLSIKCALANERELVWTATI